MLPVHPENVDAYITFRRKRNRRLLRERVRYRCTVAERAVRPLAVGRKNWLFVGSENGGRAAATILSLVQTCRNLGINPQEYLEDVLRRIMRHPARQIDKLLPDNWLAARQITV